MQNRRTKIFSQALADPEFVAAASHQLTHVSCTRIHPLRIAAQVDQNEWSRNLPISSAGKASRTPSRELPTPALSSTVNAISAAATSGGGNGDGARASSSWSRLPMAWVQINFSKRAQGKCGSDAAHRYQGRAQIGRDTQRRCKRSPWIRRRCEQRFRKRIWHTAPSV